MLGGGSGLAPMLAPLFGYFFSMIAMLTAVVVLLTSVSSVSTLGNGRHHLRPPVIDRTVTADQSAQHQSPVAQEKTSPTQDVSAIVSTAKADTKKASITKPKCLLVSTTTTAMGTRWVMPRNLGTAQEVSGSADPVRERPAASARKARNVRRVM